MHTRRNLQDFGIGKNSLVEGGVGLFVLFGAGAAVALVCWARGIAMRTTTPYQVRSVQCSGHACYAGCGCSVPMGSGIAMRTTTPYQVRFVNVCMHVPDGAEVCLLGCVL